MFYEIESVGMTKCEPSEGVTKIVKLQRYNIRNQISSAQNNHLKILKCKIKICKKDSL